MCLMGDWRWWWLVVVVVWDRSCDYSSSAGFKKSWATDQQY
jgi:hypothetical protein